jgi:hypothetical protein
MKKIISIYVLLMIPVTGLSFLVYATVQQNYRQTANDPQIQMAEDAASSLEKNWLPSALIPKMELVDIRESLAPFLIIFDDNGIVLESSAKLNGNVPVPPQGVFRFLKTGQGDILGQLKHFKPGRSGESRLTWQPERGVRIASVIVRVLGAHPGFVLAGRSLREVEIREGWLGFTVFTVWMAIAVAAFVGLLLTTHILNLKKKNGS